MSQLYGDQHRALQDQFQTRNLADRIEQTIVSDQLSAQGKAFIASRDMFFLSTVDHQGRPTVSYKGGDPGFMKVLDDRTLAFPSYDGNGMFFSMGNIAGNAQVGLLLMDFEQPFRMRIQGTASVRADDPLLASVIEENKPWYDAVIETYKPTLLPEKVPEASAPRVEQLLAFQRSSVPVH